MRIAITGPTGMIGSELMDMALSEGHEVIAIVRPSSKRMSNIPTSDRVTVVESDISDYPSLRGRFSCDIFFHLAWDKTYGSDRDDTAVQSRNILYALDAVQLAKDSGASAFIGAGSQAEYGLKDTPLNGDLPVSPSSGYGIAKYAAGRLCSLKCAQLGIRFNWARILSIFGERDSDHTMIMYLIRSFMNGDVPELTKCEQMWDYMYSKDCASALLAIGINGADGRTYCLGSGEPRPMKEYVESVRDIVSPSSKIGFGLREYYPHQPMYLCADISELGRDTGFEPRYTFEEGIRNIISYLHSKE